MRPNSNRDHALDFDRVAVRYDRARPRFDAAFVSSLCERASVTPAGARVLEIGAGTGQLTDTLLTIGCKVTALEPGTNMAQMIDHRATVLPSTFEQADLPHDSFDLIVSANAYHWVDPEVGDRRVANLLAPNGSMVLLWNFPLPPHNSQDDEAIWRDVVAADLPDSIQQRSELEAIIESTLHDGRTAMRERGVLTPQSWGDEWQTLTLSPLARLELAASYATSTDISEEELAALAADLLQRGVTGYEIDNRIHWLIARPGDAI